MNENKQQKYDILGIGFGPSNLALSIAIEEYNQKNPHAMINALFLERKAEFSWHSGMMLPDSYMQIAFPKDLATYRNPRSKYTFFNYLFEKNRLIDFVNLKTFYPTRVEFSDYLKWAAEQVDVNINFSSQVSSVKGIQNGSEISYIDKNNKTVTIDAENVVIGMGLTPIMPDFVQSSNRIFHSYNILEDIAKVKKFKHKKVAILGAGQSAAEIITYFYTEFPDVEIYTIFSRFGLSPSDSTPYNNRIFDPETVDKWYQTSDQVRQLLFAYHKSTNYSAIDESLIQKIYSLEYQELVTEHKRIYIKNAANLIACEEQNDSVNLKIRDLFTNEIEELEVDLLVCATGFSPMNIKKLVSNSEQFVFNANNLPETTREYQLKNINPDVASNIYLNGCTEHLHGFSATLLSVTAVRAQEILTSIVNKQNNN